MEVSTLVWVLTVAAIGGLLVFDFFFHVRKAHVPTLREAAVWSALYVGVPVVFGIAVLVLGGGQMGSQYFAGYVTEKALSVDRQMVHQEPELMELLERAKQEHEAHTGSGPA